MQGDPPSPGATGESCTSIGPPPRPSRVLMTADTLGGVWTYALELSEALGRRGMEIHLCTMGSALSADQRADARTVPGLEVHESRYRLEWMDDPWEDVARAGEWLLDVAHRVRPDVVHLNGYCHGALPWPAPPLMVGHSCVLSWWEAVKAEPPPVRYRRYRIEVARGLRAAGRVVAPTRAMLATLDRHYGRLPGARVIPNARSRLKLSPAVKEPFILSAGRLWDEAKNVAALAAVAGALRWPIRVAGDTARPGGGGQALDAVEALGPLRPKELGQHMARASIFALPARYEPFGLSALEAAQCGCALVLGDIPSLREVWGDAALFVSPSDLMDLKTILKALIDDVTLRETYANKALSHARRFDADLSAIAYFQEYTSLLGSGDVARTTAV
jgi:glycogen synthase